MSKHTNSEQATSLCANVEDFVITLVNLLPKLHGEVSKARSFLRQQDFRKTNAYTREMVNIPSNVANDIREAAQTAESKRFFECCRTINDASNMVSGIAKELKCIQYEVAHLSESTENPPRLQAYFVYLDQALNLLYSINLELQELQLGAKASYVHGLPDVGKRMSETEGLKDEIIRLLAIVSSTHFKSCLAE